MISLIALIKLEVPQNNLITPSRKNELKKDAYMHVKCQEAAYVTIFLNIYSLSRVHGKYGNFKKRVLIVIGFMWENNFIDVGPSLFFFIEVHWRKFKINAF